MSMRQRGSCRCCVLMHQSSGVVGGVVSLSSSCTFNVQHCEFERQHDHMTLEFQRTYNFLIPPPITQPYATATTTTHPFSQILSKVSPARLYFANPLIIWKTGMGPRIQSMAYECMNMQVTMPQFLGFSYATECRRAADRP